MDVGKAILRDYIKATMGFEELSSLTEKSAKSLMRMFSPKGNPQARNLFAVIDHLQKKEGVQLQVHTIRRSRNSRHRYLIGYGNSLRTLHSAELRPRERREHQPASGCYPGPDDRLIFESSFPVGVDRAGDHNSDAILWQGQAL